MFENKRDPLLPSAAFLARMGRNFAFGLLIVAVSMLIGSCGYHYFGELAWIDSVLNAAMILTGMGPVNPMTSTAGKLFATFYALYSGIAFLTMITLILAPLIHRLLHRFHVDEGEDDDNTSNRT
ncbi:MAG: hypothetical protein JNG89_01420 [Planctomycetaceae bacterium]|nr:hypothetical protein [Planctomycetaceae bacterium]